MRKFAKVAAASAAALVMSMCLLCGCSLQPSPTEVTETFLDAIKAQDSERCAKVYSGDSSELGDPSDTLFGISGDGDSESNLTESQQEVLQAFFVKLLDFDYTVTEETVNEGTAEVDVEFTTYDSGKAMTNALTEYLSKAFVYALSTGADGSEMTDTFIDALQDETDDMVEKDRTESVTFKLSKTDSGWMIDSIDEDQIDAMFGGVYSSVKAMSGGN